MLHGRHLDIMMLLFFCCCTFYYGFMAEILYTVWRYGIYARSSLQWANARPVSNAFIFHHTHYTHACTHFPINIFNDIFCCMDNFCKLCYFLSMKELTTKNDGSCHLSYLSVCQSVRASDATSNGNTNDGDAYVVAVAQCWGQSSIRMLIVNLFPTLLSVCLLIDT